MADRPILMSAAMVRACLREIEECGSGKTATRRVVTPGTTTMDGAAWCNYVAPEAFRLNDAWKDESFGPESPMLKMPWDRLGEDMVARLRPRIEVGDRLWVREIWCTDGQVDAVAPRDLSNGEPIGYLADGNIRTSGCMMVYRGRNRPSIHMPRWASRLTLEVNGVSFERLQDITEGGAISEGIEKHFYDGEDPAYAGAFGWKDYRDHPHAVVPFNSPLRSFETLWDSINATRGYGWGDNPWVVVVRFEPCLCNIDQMRQVA